MIVAIKLAIIIAVLAGIAAAYNSHRQNQEAKELAKKQPQKQRRTYGQVDPIIRKRYNMDPDETTDVPNWQQWLDNLHE